MILSGNVFQCPLPEGAKKIYELECRMNQFIDLSNQLESTNIQSITPKYLYLDPGEVANITVVASFIPNLPESLQCQSNSFIQSI